MKIDFLYLCKEILKNKRASNWILYLHTNSCAVIMTFMDCVRRDRTIRKVLEVKRDKRQKMRKKNREGRRQRKRIKEIRIRETKGYYLFILLFSGWFQRGGSRVN